MKRSGKIVFCALSVLLSAGAVSWLSLVALAELSRTSFLPTKLAPSQNGLATALNSDGTLKSGARGSFDASGYRMALTMTGAPRFVPVETCSGWDTQFSLPNGVSGDSVVALLASGTDIYVGGYFSTAGNVTANNVAKFNTLTNTWSALGSGGGNGVFGRVAALALSGSDLYVGGGFTTANVGSTTVSTNSVAKFNTLTNTWSALGSGGGNGVNFDVSALALIGSDLYVGGNFTTANVGGTTISANRVARFNTLTNTWSALGSGGGNGVNNTVLGLALIGSDLYVGGQFTTANVGGTIISANHVARFNTLTNTWGVLGTDNGNGVNHFVIALLVSGTDIYVGGQFSEAGGVNAYKVAKFNTLTNTWSPLGTDSNNGVSSNVYALALIGSDLYVGGDFTTANVGLTTTVSTNSVAKFNTLTNTWSALGSGGGNGVNKIVYALAVSGSDLCVGGDFTKANEGGPTIRANFVAKVNTTTGVWDTLGTGGNGVAGGVAALVISGTDIYIGGVFSAVGDFAANSVAKFNTLTNTWSTLGTGGGNGLFGQVNALAVSGSDLYVGGGFTTVNHGGPPVSANYVAKVNTITGVWSPLGTGGGSGVNGPVYALAASGNDLFVGGYFSAASSGSTPVFTSNVAKFNTLTNTWSALGSGGGNGTGIVYALAVSGNDLYVGGLFALVNVGGPSVSANHVAKVNTLTGVWSALGTGGGSGVNGEQVFALAANGSDLYVGGDFTMANLGGPLVSAKRLAKVNTTTGVWSALGTVGNEVDYNVVYDLTISGNNLYVGGQFETVSVGGTTINVNNVAKMDTTTGVWSALTDIGGGYGVNRPVNALATGERNLFVGGYFTVVGDNKVSLGIARYCTNTVPTLPAPQSTLGKLAPTDPLLCAGEVLNGSFGQTNPTALAQSGRVFATLQNLVALPTSIACVLSPAAGGATTFCAVENGAPTWRGTLVAGQSVTITYQAQVLDTVVGNAQVCSTAQAQFPDVTGTIVIATPFCLMLRCPTVGPGMLLPATSEISDQKRGSVLVYNLHSSSVATPDAQNTRLAITNTNPALSIAVHLFFVDGATCSIADSLICLTPNQTTSFLASDIDPGTTGYIVAVASDRVTGCPVSFNFLIGDEYVKLSSKHAANLAAESFAALAGGLPLCDGNTVTAVLNFDGMSYNRMPRVLATSNIPSRAEGNDTLLVLNRLGGNLGTGAATLTNLFGILYDDAEHPFSFSFSPGTCQFRSALSNSFPRTTPRFEQAISAGRSGWAKLYAQDDLGLLGAQLNFNPNAVTVAGAFNQGHNLHKLRLAAAVQLTIPVFPPNC